MPTAASKSRLALFGGLYSNYLALEAALADVQRRGADARYCLGDLGAFGPYPNRVFPLLRDYRVTCIQGNYDHSIGNELADCQCGYTDPRDNHFAQVSYDYTLSGTSAENRRWLRDLPEQLRLELGPLRLLLCHGSPRRTNEFLWESTSSTQFLEYLCDQHATDVILATHTGIKWKRELSRGASQRAGGLNPPAHRGRWMINVGVLGRPENDGHTHVWYTLLEYDPAGGLKIEFVPVQYDHERLAREMRDEKLPEEFVETILTGWWTTCLEVLPAKERKRGKW